jgi:hypothetical protein
VISGMLSKHREPAGLERMLKGIDEQVESTNTSGGYELLSNKRFNH